MNDTSSPTPSERLAFLHRRPFWAVVLGFVSLICFLLSPSGPPLYSGLEDAITSLAITFGGLFWLSLVAKLLAGASGYFLSILYVLFITYLLIQTFRQEKVPLRYPIIFLSVVGVAYVFLIGLYGL
jgi:hypothetical protein